MAKSVIIKSRGAANDLAFIILAILILRILPILFGSMSSPDIVLYMRQAAPILDNKNIYTVTRGVFPYSPLTAFIPALCLLLANKSNIPFYVTMKIPALIGDISLAMAVYYWIIRAKNDPDTALRGGILYAINPLVILISAFQGNMMSLPTLFMFLAVMMVIYDCEKNYRRSALLLSLAIAFRGYPILLLPLILLKSRVSFSKKLRYAGYAIVPVIVIFMPFLVINYKSIIREIVGYSGNNDYGFVAIERALCLYFYVCSHNFVAIDNTMLGYVHSFYKLHSCIFPNTVIVQLFRHSKTIFLLAYITALSQYRRIGLLKLALTVYLGFYFFYAGVASQYFIWVIPFLYFLNDKLSVWYIIFGTYAVISCFLCYYPFILFGRFTVYPITAIQHLLLNEVTALSLFWSLCGIWFFTLLFKKESLAAPQ